MTAKLSFSLALIPIFLSCNNQEQEPAKTEKLNCYSYTNNKDTAMLNTVLTNGQLTGTLIYNLFEKDKNIGTIQGVMKGDLLIADYTFNSEGVQSVRQVAFKKSGNTFIEGYGMTETKNEKTIFVNTDSLIFNNSIVFTEVDCEK